MKNAKFIVLLPGLVILLLSSCIERIYYAGVGNTFVPELVITGSINTDKQEQEIVISKTSSPEDPRIASLSGCDVRVEDNQGKNFTFNETVISGHYMANLKGSSLQVGNQYRLIVITPEGKQYISKYEELLPCPEVDSVYSELEVKPTANPEVNEDGLQFYVDLVANENQGHFFRWQLVETFEYHSTYPLEKWLDDDGYHDLIKPDYSNFTCYKTENVRDIFVLSTKGFTNDSYLKYKLHFVNDHTQRLLHKYSLLVKQFSLSEGAYYYWLNLKKNNQESMDLFGRQPANTKGNIYNANDSTDVALGYFSVSTVRTKRIMLSSVKGLSFDQVPYCKAYPQAIPPDERPVYFADEWYEGEKVTGVTNADCVICTLLGGTTDKPDYWDQITGSYEKE